MLSNRFFFMASHTYLGINESTASHPLSFLLSPSPFPVTLAALTSASAPVSVSSVHTRTSIASLSRPLAELLHRHSLDFLLARADPPGGPVPRIASRTEGNKQGTAKLHSPSTYFRYSRLPERPSAEEPNTEKWCH